jgi:hypothetical protein
VEPHRTSEPADGPPAGADLDRMDLRARPLLIDATAKDRERSPGTPPPSGSSGTAPATIHTTDPTAAERVSAALRSLGELANKDRSEAEAPRVPALRTALPT